MSNSIIALSKLSVRAKNVCRYYDFITTDDINDYILSGRNIYTLKNCGKRTAEEILNFTNNSSQSYSLIENEYRIIQKYDYRKKIFNLILSYELSKLSVRARNGFYLIADNDKNLIQTFIEKAIFNNISFKSFKNIGLKASNELNDFRIIIQKLILKFSDSNLEREDFLIIKFEHILKIEIKEDFKLLLKNKKVDLIHFFDKYILESLIFSRRIFKSLIINYLNPENKKYDTIKKISEERELTRERVRQLKLNLFKETDFKVFSEILSFSDFFINNVSNDSYTKVIDIVPTFQKELKYLNVDSITLVKIIDLISINHSIILEGEELDAINSGYNVFNRDFYKTFKVLKVNYIFSKKFINKEVCFLILNNVFEKNCKRVEEDFYFNPFNDYNFSTEQEDFLKKLVVENLNIPFSENGFLIQRNTIITIEEIIEEILIRVNKPLLISEIYESLIKSYPGRCKNENAVRTAITREKERFIYLRGATKEGLTLYGLKEWEKTKNLKGGSIKQLCINYLKLKEQPIHILELTRFVLKYRDTNQNSVRTNLQAGTHNNFIFFKSNFIGLKTIKYDENIIESFKILGGAQAKYIGEFIKNNIYYNYNSVVRKFSNDLDFYPIQIEQTILNYINTGVLKQKGDKLYYNSIQEDSIIKDLFSAKNDVEISGYNPYMINLDREKLVIRVKQSSIKSEFIEKPYFDFSGYHNREYFSKQRCLLIYNPYIRCYKAFLWKEDLDIEKIDLTINFQIDIDFRITNIDSAVNLVEFSKEKSNKFISLLKIILDSEMEYDVLKVDGKTINLNYLNVDGLSELNAITEITNEAFKKYKIELEIKEAREIYQRIKLTKN